jgi:hypothetical protein
MEAMPDQFFTLYRASCIPHRFYPYFAYSTYLLSRTTVTLI